jgi:hypothetical protein
MCHLGGDPCDPLDILKLTPGITADVLRNSISIHEAKITISSMPEPFYFYYFTVPAQIADFWKARNGDQTSQLKLERDVAILEKDLASLSLADAKR